MDYFFRDFNGADRYFGGSGSAEWTELERVISSLPLFLQASDQASKVGAPIFDPKATNQFLTCTSQEFGWDKIAVPEELDGFGNDWDAGKGSTLAEWQFSNYPFLWNNVLRTEVLFKSGWEIDSMSAVEALVVVTKSGILPASNSTLYFEQALKQLDLVTALGIFDIPLRLIGLTLPEGHSELDAIWTRYEGRYARQGEAERVRVGLKSGTSSRYGVRPARFEIKTAYRR